MENQDIKIEHRGKFDVAIEVLRRRFFHIASDPAVDLEMVSIDSAIRLFEAAGRVDKDRALAWLKHIEQYLESGDGDWQITDEDREMLRLVRLPLSALID
jgi:hypothetical protein